LAHGADCYFCVFACRWGLVVMDRPGWQKSVALVGGAAAAGGLLWYLLRERDHWHEEESQVVESTARRSRWGKKVQDGSQQHATSSTSTSAPSSAAGSDGVWNFAFGANINPWKLRDQRKITPKEEVVGRLRGWRLVFNHKGGMGNIERWTVADNGPDAVHGMLLHLSARDFEKLSKMEHEYTTVDVEVETYDGRTISAKAFVTPPKFRLSTYPAPPERYLNLIKDGAATSQLDSAYASWLGTLPSVKGERGEEYWSCPGKKPNPRGTQETSSESKKSSHLCLPGCKLFAIRDGTTLVDIGANLAKCKPQDLAEQLARSASAGVSRLILTGCSVRGSQESQRICQQWSGAKGMQLAERHLGAAAWGELCSLGMPALPSLTFTAGVHPHDAKGCDEHTIDILRGLAADDNCVSIGECGLDYDRMFTPRDVQLTWCRKQVELAVELGMPLFLHERDQDAKKGRGAMGSSRELLEILTSSGVEPSKVCVHCYTGDEETLKKYVSRGYFIGLTGFAGMRKRGAHIREFLSGNIIPLSQLMIETDCPFMMPDSEYIPPMLGLQDRRMEACALPAVCNAVAEAVGQSPEAIARITTENAVRFFGLA